MAWASWTTVASSSNWPTAMRCAKSIAWEQTKDEMKTEPNGYIVFDDTVLDKNHSHKIDLVRLQYSGNALHEPVRNQTVKIQGEGWCASLLPQGDDAAEDHCGAQPARGGQLFLEQEGADEGGKNDRGFTQRGNGSRWRLG